MTRTGAVRHDYDVIVSGAGPTGLLLAIDLGQRGIRVLVLEKNPSTSPYPKMERTNSRSMEIFRRLGLVNEVRAVGYPADTSMDVFIVNDLTDPILKLPYPTVAEQRAAIAAEKHGRLPLEPYQLVSQYDLEPVLARRADALDTVAVRFAHDVTGFTQDDNGVAVSYTSPEGEKISTAAFFVGCDGGASPTRKALGVELEGRGRIQRRTQVQFRAPDLYDKIPVGKGRHYYFTDGSIIVTQGNRVDFSLHTSVTGDDAAYEEAVRRHIPSGVEFEVLRRSDWTLNLLLADKYRVGRVFLAGDAVHLVIPTGGLGMNTAVGDAIDLSWKLAACLQGWGGDALLDSYEIERRRVGAFNVSASGWAAEGLRIWVSEVDADVTATGPAGEQARARIRELGDIYHRRVHEMVGAELGYHYAGSPIVLTEDGPEPGWDVRSYIPSAMPGCRLPHMWLSDGTPIFDHLGSGFTVLVLSDAVDGAGLVAAAEHLGIPVELRTFVDSDLEQMYGARVLLIRPDFHVAWRSWREPEEPAAIWTTVTGRPDAAMPRP